MDYYQRGPLSVLNRSVDYSAIKPSLSTLPLEISDPELTDLILGEKELQKCSINLLPCSSITSQATMELNSSVLTNKYTEGHNDQRYYGGCDNYAKLEDYTKSRLLEGFSLDPQDWEACTQVLPGSLCMFAALNAVLKPKDSILGLVYNWDESAKIQLNEAYTVNRYFDLDILGILKQGVIDYTAISQAMEQKKYTVMVTVLQGFYTKDIEWSILAKICNEHGVKLFADIGLTAGFISVGLMNNPFPYSDLVLLTNLGSQGITGCGVILANKKKDPNMINLITRSVFPGLQGGPHNQKIVGMGTQMKEMKSPLWKMYWENVIQNSKFLANALIDRGFDVFGGGTDTQVILINLRQNGINARLMTLACDILNIHIEMDFNPTINSCSEEEIDAVYGIVLGTTTITLREVTTEDLNRIADIMLEALNLAKLFIERNSSHSKSILAETFEAEFANMEDVKLASIRNYEWAKSLPWIVDMN